MWPTVAINKDQLDEGTCHQDYSDDPRVFNGVIPYGLNFETGWLVFWQLGMAELWF